MAFDLGTGQVKALLPAPCPLLTLKGDAQATGYALAVLCGEVDRVLAPRRVCLAVLALVEGAH